MESRGLCDVPFIAAERQLKHARASGIQNLCKPPGCVFFWTTLDENERKWQAILRSRSSVPLNKETIQPRSQILIPTMCRFCKRPFVVKQKRTESQKVAAFCTNPPTCYCMGGHRPMRLLQVCRFGAAAAWHETPAADIHNMFGLQLHKWG